MLAKATNNSCLFIRGTHKEQHDNFKQKVLYIGPYAVRDHGEYC